MNIPRIKDSTKKEGANNFWRQAKGDATVNFHTEETIEKGSAHRLFTQTRVPRATLTVTGTMERTRTEEVHPYQRETPVMLTNPQTGEVTMGIQSERGTIQTVTSKVTGRFQISATAPAGQEISLNPGNGMGSFFIGSTEGLRISTGNTQRQLPPAQETEE